MNHNITTLDQTKQLAQKLAALIHPTDVIELRGDLGAGKTTFARYLINALCESEQEVLSPTFNLVHLYDGKEGPIWHFDLYRLENENEVEQLGIYDAFDEAISIIEWPEIISGILPQNRLLLSLRCNGDDREVAFTAYGDWQERIQGL